MLIYFRCYLSGSNIATVFLILDKLSELHYLGIILCRYKQVLIIRSSYEKFLNRFLVEVLFRYRINKDTKEKNSYLQYSTKISQQVQNAEYVSLMLNLFGFKIQSCFQEISWFMLRHQIKRIILSNVKVIIFSISVVSKLEIGVTCDDIIVLYV